MKHHTAQTFLPALAASAACGVAQPGRGKVTLNTFGVRLFKD